VTVKRKEKREKRKENEFIYNPYRNKSNQQTTKSRLIGG